MSVQAQWPGTCPGCGETWQAGDLIRSRPVGAEHVERWQHDTCPDPLATEHPVCTTCWLTHPEGACDR